MKSEKLIKNLGIVLGVLIVVYLGTLLLGGKKERNFRTVLFSADTSAVTQILIYPEVTKGKEVKLFKDGDTWKVNIAENKSVSVPSDKIKSLKQKLTEFKIERLVSKTPAKWSAFKVDSSGTRVKVYEGSNLVADFIVGKFEMQGRRNFVSYVRNADEDETYLVNGFMSPSFNRKADSFRNNYVLKTDKSKLTRLEFSYPADSSFTMTKDSSNRWLSNGIELDSATVAKYLSSISRLYSSNYVNEFPSDFPKTPAFTLKIETENGSEEIKCYVKGNESIIESTYDGENYFDGEKAKLREKIFKGKTYFLPKEKSKKAKKKK